MDPAQFFAASRVLIVAGKGGVGKSTVSAALARTAARAGLSTLIVEIEGKSGISGLFGRPPFGYEEAVLHPGGGPEGAADARRKSDVYDHDRPRSPHRKLASRKPTCDDVVAVHHEPGAEEQSCEHSRRRQEPEESIRQ